MGRFYRGSFGNDQQLVVARSRLAVESPAQDLLHTNRHTTSASIERFGGTIGVWVG
ncbi:MAG: hypothetical protein OXF98_13355 [Rhodospirillaceae bacterium]|nr:hypothetical protein [Rhodospirillaceae bacterium]